MVVSLILFSRLIIITSQILIYRWSPLCYRFNWYVMDTIKYTVFKCRFYNIDIKGQACTPELAVLEILHNRVSFGLLGVLHVSLIGLS